MFVHCEGGGRSRSFRSCQHAHKGFVKGSLASIGPIGNVAITRGELPRFFESCIVNNFLVIARIVEGVKCRSRCKREDVCNAIVAVDHDVPVIIKPGYAAFAVRVQNILIVVDKAIIGSVIKPRLN